MDWQTALVGVLGVLNLVATLAAMRSTNLSGGQRAIQVALIWLLPLIGAVISLAFVTTEARAVRESTSPHHASMHGADDGGTVTSTFPADCFGGGDSCGDGGGGGGGD